MASEDETAGCCGAYPLEASVELSPEQIQALSSDPAFGRYLRRLRSEGRDVEGKLLHRDSTIVCHPIAPEVFKEDSPENRQEFLRLDCGWTDDVRQRVWFPKASGLSPATQGGLETARVAKQEFTSAIDENLVSAREDLFPNTGLSAWQALVPWEPKITRVEIVADLTSDLVTHLKSISNVPRNLAWPADWEDTLHGLNSAKVYSLRCFGAAVNILVAFVTSLRFKREAEPRVCPLTQAVIEAVRQTYQQWLTCKRPATSRFSFITTGAPKPCSHEVAATASGDYRVILSWRNPDGTWETRFPSGFVDRLSLRNLLDRLKPETREQRVSKIKHAIDELLDTGYEGNAHLDKIAKATGYRRTHVRDTFLALQREGGYRLYWTGQHILAIDRQIGRQGRGITAATFHRNWILRNLPTILSPLAGIGIWFVADFLLGKPFQYSRFAVVLPLAYLGAMITKCVDRVWSDKE